ncbi:hypothetical protein [Mycolicibacterium sp.]
MSARGAPSRAWIESRWGTVAGLLEIVGALAIKQSDGFTRLW